MKLYMSHECFGKSLEKNLIQEGAKQAFISMLKLLNHGEVFNKRVSIAGNGASGCIFLPKHYIGQQVRVTITPANPEVVNMQEALRNQEKKMRRMRKEHKKTLGKLAEAMDAADMDPSTFKEAEDIKENPDLEDDDAF